MSTTVAPFPFPGRLIKSNHANSANDVLAIQRRLNELGCGPLAETGIFDNPTVDSVKLFQSRFNDTHGIPLEIDGEIGSLTWGSLFGRESTPEIRIAGSRLLERVLAVAQGEIGIREEPPHSNRGPRVDEYLRSVGLNPERGSFAWCVAFIYFCFNEAARQLNVVNPMIRTAQVLEHWRLAGARGIPRIASDAAVHQPGLVQPGHIFVIDTGGGHGHSGLVEAVADGKLVTIEGNTSESGSREGIGVFRRASRKVAGINTGFIDYSRF